MRRIAVLLIIALAVSFPLYAKSKAVPKNAAEPDKKIYDDLRFKLKSNITVDRSVKGDVLRILGEPNIKETMDYSNFRLSGIPFVDETKIMAKETWIYVSVDKARVWEQDNVTVTLGGVVFCHNLNYIMVFFDDKDKVVGYQLGELVK